MSTEADDDDDETPTMEHGDKEREAMRACDALLRTLPPAARTRVWRWLGDFFDLDNY